MTALADGEAVLLVHGYRVDEGDLHLDMIARHDHLDRLGELDGSGDVGGSEVELRTVAVEERSVAAALLLVEDIDL